MTGWSGFYELIGEAAATLVGLMFIAATFGSKLVTPETLNRARAFLSPIIHHFLQAFVIACVALVPGAPLAWTGAAATGTALLRLLLLPILVKEMRVSDDVEFSDWLLNIILPGLLFGLLLLSGVALCSGESAACYGLALGSAGLLVMGILNAWETLVWMASRLV